MKTTLIPRRVLFGNPDRSNVQISPDGKFISYLAPLNGVLNVWVDPTDGIETARSITQDTGRGVQIYTWAHNSTHILYLQDKGGDENWRLYSTDITTQTTKDLTPFDKVQTQIHSISQDSPEEILIQMNKRNPQAHDVYRLNISTGEMTMVYENTEGFLSFLHDNSYKLRFGTISTPEGGIIIHKRTDADSWEVFAEVNPDDTMGTTFINVTHDGNILYMSDNRNRNTAVLITIDLETGEKTVVAENDQADLSHVITNPQTGEIQAVAFTYKRRAWAILDEDIQPDLDYLSTLADGELTINSRTHDDKQWIVVYVMDDGPVRYYLYDRDNKQATFLFVNNAELEDVALAKMQSAIIQSRDGLNLVCYYTLPLGSNTKETHKPDAPVPLVLLVHGGPWARDNWGYSAFHQWLSNRGYAVLNVNFRGSTGFGKDFLNAGDGQWGDAMHDDLIDAVDWAIEQGITTDGQVAIMGGSYGGYATLAGLTFTPDRFVCGVDIVGPSNIITLLRSTPPQWKAMQTMLFKRMGNPEIEADRERLARQSPLTHIDKIKRPLLIGQGANDPRVPQAESDQIVSAMKEKNIPVTYALYPDEGHGFVRPENRLSFFAVTEAFLATNLEGNFEPIGEDFDNSSIQVKSGAENIPGVSDALASGSK